MDSLHANDNSPSDDRDPSSKQCFMVLQSCGTSCNLRHTTGWIHSGIFPPVWQRGSRCRLRSYPWSDARSRLRHPQHSSNPRFSGTFLVHQFMHHDFLLDSIEANQQQVQELMEYHKVYQESAVLLLWDNGLLRRLLWVHHRSILELGSADIHTFWRTSICHQRLLFLRCHFCSDALWIDLSDKVAIIYDTEFQEVQQKMEGLLPRNQNEVKMDVGLLFDILCQESQLLLFGLILKTSSYHHPSNKHAS